MSDGLVPTLMVAVTVLVTVLILVTELDPALTTQVRGCRDSPPPCATPTGLVPTLTVAITLSVASRTVTVPAPLLVTYVLVIHSYACAERREVDRLRRIHRRRGVAYGDRFDHRAGGAIEHRHGVGVPVGHIELVARTADIRPGRRTPCREGAGDHQLRLCAREVSGQRFGGGDFGRRRRRPSRAPCSRRSRGARRPAVPTRRVNRSACPTCRRARWTAGWSSRRWSPSRSADL